MSNYLEKAKRFGLGNQPLFGILKNLIRLSVFRVFQKQCRNDFEL